jgi:hypothetical protein
VEIRAKLRRRWIRRARKETPHQESRIEVRTPTAFDDCPLASGGSEEDGVSCLGRGESVKSKYHRGIYPTTGNRQQGE